MTRWAAAALTLVTTILGVAIAPPATAAQPADVKVQLIHMPLSNCEFGADALPGTGTPSSSFTIAVDVRGEVLRAEVVLTDAVPDADYTVYLIQSDGDLAGEPLDCHRPDGTLTTNRQGNGTLRLTDDRLSQARYVHVYLYTLTRGFDDFDTRLIPLR